MPEISDIKVETANIVPDASNPNFKSPKCRTGGVVLIAWNFS